MESASRLYVGGLNPVTSAPVLGRLFEGFGLVRNAQIATADGRSRGFGYVEMVDPAAAERALAALNGYMLDGNQVSVQYARGTRGARGPRAPAPAPPPQTAPARTRGAQAQPRAPPQQPPPQGRGPRSAGRAPPAPAPPPPPAQPAGAPRRRTAQRRQAPPAAPAPAQYAPPMAAPPVMPMPPAYAIPPYPAMPFPPFGGYPQLPPYMFGGFGGPRRFPRGARSQSQTAPRRRRRQRTPFDTNAPLNETRLHVSNLPFDLTKEELQEAFKDYQVKEVTLFHQRFNTTRNVGFGYVDLVSAEEQKKVLDALPTVTIKGRPCKVHAALATPPQQAAVEAPAAPAPPPAQPAAQ